MPATTFKTGIGLKKYHLRNLYSKQNNQVLAGISQIIDGCTESAVERFYNELTSFEKSKKFLSEQMVQDRLKNELKSWIEDVLSPKSETDIPTLIDKQYLIGEVHARIDIPMDLVDSAMFLIKHTVFLSILDSQLDKEMKNRAIILVDAILSASLAIIDQSYLKDLVENERIAQEYKGHVSAQEIALEIEGIKSQTYKWLSNLMAVLASNKEYKFRSINKDDVVLWIIHKLPQYVNKPSFLEPINDTVNQIEQIHIEISQNTENRSEAILLLQKKISELNFLLTEIANANLHESNQLDALSSLTERRFLDPIMQKETQIALQMQSRYSVIMADIDNFKLINDQFGHQVGDDVIKHVSKILKTNIRVSDYIFRYGGEEFLILLPETDLKTSIHIAEKLRQKLEQSIIETHQADKSLTVTCSLGVAEFANHPDYMQVIKRADEKLYQSKNNGKNQVSY
ncbi:GGDEF domain-containing protein [Thiomicrorhabdus sediminis]|uniref:Diguanylate cyclase DosC n=1 Tax=Thiomicrorhabdus sediminis TaxID=2580412 RepID=A0A4P9K2V9_9GAMM|nr:GGDEF domain-containing protein [Thiomicrorhabdus sediminis]QCU89145.1 GGDEF domain-containing protein [Thiomicrorhabdus sediminis]